MAETIILTFIMMAGLFLLLLAAVGFIQDKRFFTSAPKDIQAVIGPRAERFPGAHALGWCLAVLSLIMMLGPLTYTGWSGVRSGLGFRQFLARFLTMLLGLKVFDVLFFDAFLLCHSNFFPHFYPETASLVGPHLFGFNWKSHVAQTVALMIAALIAAWICAML